jgi:hypothetical protein
MKQHRHYLETEESELNLNRSDLAMHAAKHHSFILMDVNIAPKRLIDHLVPSLDGVAMLLDEVRKSFIPQIPNNNLTFDIENRVGLIEDFCKLKFCLHCMDLH